MSTSKSTPMRLIDGARGQGGGEVAAAPVRNDFYRKLAYHPDEKEAAALAAEQAGLEFDRDNPEFGRLKMELPDLDARYKASKSALALLEEKLKNTPQYISACAEHTGTDKNSVGFSDWRPLDKIGFVFVAAALITCVFMSAANVYGVLVNSGEMVFIEKPWIAVFLSLLAPAGSVALKFISGFFDYYRTKKRYTLIIFMITAFSFLAWSVLFAMNYSGAAGGVDYGDIGEGNIKASLLVWIQLLTEILVGAALFLAGEAIALKYSPEIYTENLAYINAGKAVKNFLPEHEKLREERNQKHARYAELSAARQVFINEKIADYLALRARFNAINNF